MTIIRRYEFEDNSKITKIICDESGGYLWIAHERDADGVIHLKKVSANDLSQVYFDIEITDALSIVDMYLYGGNLYVLYNGTTANKLYTRYSANAPLTTYTHVTKPYGTPEPMAIVANSLGRLILLPDSSGGINAKILRFNTSNVYAETVNISTLLESSETLWEVSSMTTDTSDNLWLVTNTSPVKLARVWFASGGWSMRITSIS